MSTDNTSCGERDTRNKRSYAINERRAPPNAPSTTPPTTPATAPTTNSPKIPIDIIARATRGAPPGVPLRPGAQEALPMLEPAEGTEPNSSRRVEEEAEIREAETQALTEEH